LREQPEAVAENARNKGYDIDVNKLVTLYDERRTLQQQVDELREKRNQNAAKMKGGQPDQATIDEGKQIKVELSEREGYLADVEQEFTNLYKQVPNMAAEDVPLGASEDENVVTKTVGDKPSFDFAPRNHYEIAEQRDWIDKLKEITSNAGLEVLGKPFTPILPPLMIRTEPYDAMDRLEPRDDRYKLEDDDLWLQGSAEHVLGSMHADEIFDESQLPLRYLGYATSFRREAGTYGKDMEGILRMHQFDKLEMESFTVAEDGMKEHLLFVAIQEYLLSSLGLHYQVLQKCTADIGKPNARGVDLETWLPGQDKFRETHTADYMTDYQARRLKTRVRRSSGDLELIHTNDATAFALGRVMIAIIENYQDSEGKVKIPEALRSYLGNREVL
jgi:seryl-tRNA synthetase